MVDTDGASLTTQDIPGSEQDELSKLRGGHVAQVDEKFRLKIPADFKRQFDEVSWCKQFYVSRVKTAKGREIYPTERVAEA